MISQREIVSDGDFKNLNQELKANLVILLDKLNKVRALYGKVMVCTSGFRSMENHLEIYRKKAEKAGVPFDESKVPKKSKHLFCQAADFSDPTGELKKWAALHEKELLEIGVWLEAADSTPGWLHAQSVPYESWKPGKSIWFNP